MRYRTWRAELGDSVQVDACVTVEVLGMALNKVEKKVFPLFIKSVTSSKGALGSWSKFFGETVVAQCQACDISLGEEVGDSQEQLLW